MQVSVVIGDLHVDVNFMMVAQANFCTNLCQEGDNYADLTDNSETDLSNTEIDQKLVSVTGLDQDEQSDPCQISLKNSDMSLERNQEDFIKSRPVEIQLRKVRRDEIHRMERLGIIERSDTIYINSIVPVFKKNNSVRVCLAALDPNEQIQLLKKGTKWRWTEEDNIAFKKVNQLFISDILLSHLKLDCPFFLRTDSSTTGHKGSEKIVITPELVEILIRKTHIQFGHVGAKKNKTYTGGTSALSSPIIPEGPRDLISIDFCGSYPTGQRGVKYLLVILDTFTKYVVIYPIVKATARITIKKIFDDYIPLHGRPERIQADHLTQFTSKLWLNKLKDEQIVAMFSSIRHPQSRFFRSLALKKHSAWPSWIPFIESCLNESYHDTTEFTPLELQTGKRPSRFWENLVTVPQRTDLLYAEKLALVNSRIKIKGDTRAAKINSSRSLKMYAIGDKVLAYACYFSNASSQVSVKFMSLYEGPYIVCAVYNECTYKIAYPDSEQIRGTFHSSELRPYYETETPGTKYPRPLKGHGTFPQNNIAETHEEEITSNLDPNPPLSHKPPSPTFEKRRQKREEFIRKYRARIVKKRTSPQIPPDNECDVLVIEENLELVKM
ncbi:hypothetical protein TSAR_001624 [Trichomalopsis sarcophagae]|uniref:Integrase catalytic domain-containing protein n=1 Tax=Trichomalopsis sarcophagae TaxID=543379 RepID=A0A232EP04_9HYME|nr:hypothetical protein TSAR_001624 [Trichomalopsis sarcophagae]